MTDETNRCLHHKRVESDVTDLKVNKKAMWKAIGAMVPWRTFVVIGSIVIIFGLLLIKGNSSAIDKNTVKIECLEAMAIDIKAIKDVIVP